MLLPFVHGVQVLRDVANSHLSIVIVISSVVYIPYPRSYFVVTNYYLFSFTTIIFFHSQCPVCFLLLPLPRIGCSSSSCLSREVNRHPLSLFVVATAPHCVHYLAGSFFPFFLLLFICCNRSLERLFLYLLRFCSDAFNHQLCCALSSNFNFFFNSSPSI